MSAAHDGDRTTARALEVERSVNERYQQELEALVKRSPKLKNAIGASPSASWTGTAPRTAVSRAVVSPIEGRVGLKRPVEGLGTSFYVGGLWGAEWEGNGEEVLVVSWAAPVAKLFFHGASAADDRAGDVGGTRTFEVVGGAVRSFEDDLLPGISTSETLFPLPGSERSAVPRAPRPVDRPMAARRATPTPPSDNAEIDTRTRLSDDSGKGEQQAPTRPPSETATGAAPSAGDEPSTTRTTQNEHGPGNTPQRSPVAASPVEGLRAAGSVLAALQRPRTGGLGSVLSTLQPEQYDLVTKPHDRPLIVEGRPGTGKTIIATHRAAFLTHREREGGAIGTVVLVGPSPEWARHISPSLQALNADGVAIRDLPDLLSEWANTPATGIPGREARVDTEWALGRFFADAVTILGLRDSGRESIRKAVDRITAQPPQLEYLIGRYADIGPWLREAGSYQNMAKYRRYLPALAAVGAALGRKPSERYDHVIVDEAQDLRPLEWRIVQRLLRSGGSMTLLGDLNQRRSDWTHDSWQGLAVDLELTDDDGIVDVEELTVGYRSTTRILRFAGQLLPRGQRSATAVREGTDPAVTRVAPADLEIEVVASARTLAARHPGGRVAIITMNPRVSNDLLRGAKGWRRTPGELNIWEYENLKIVVTHPERARGLEFDAVVVVEPKSFPTNVGREGVLYTSLTRATQELSVLHSKGLPKDLRAPRA